MRRRGSSETISPEGVSEKVLGYFEERFGLRKGLFEPYGLYLASKGRVYLGPKRVPDMPKIATIGLMVARVGDTVKPSTNLLQAFGNSVTRNAIDLDARQAAAYAKGGDIMPGKAQLNSISDGYVLLRHAGAPLGCGWLKGGAVRNMLPKAKRLEIQLI